MRLRWELRIWSLRTVPGLTDSPAVQMEANTMNSYFSINILVFTRRKNSFAGNYFPCNRIRCQCCLLWSSITSYYLQGIWSIFTNWLKAPIQESGSLSVSLKCYERNHKLEPWSEMAGSPPPHPESGYFVRINLKTQIHEFSRIQTHFF